MRVYYVSSKDYESDMSESKVSELALSDQTLHGMYDDALNDVYGVLSIAGIGDYETSRVLQDTDPVAYRVGFSDWLDSEIDETIVELSFD